MYIIVQRKQLPKWWLLFQMEIFLIFHILIENIFSERGENYD